MAEPCRSVYDPGATRGAVEERRHPLPTHDPDEIGRIEGAIRSLVTPVVWEGRGQVYRLGGELVVRAPEPVHESVAKFLADWAQWRDEPLVVTVAIMAVDPSRLEGMPEPHAVLDDGATVWIVEAEGAEALAEGSQALAMPRLAVLPGQEGTVETASGFVLGTGDDQRRMEADVRRVEVCAVPNGRAEDGAVVRFRVEVSDRVPRRQEIIPVVLEGGRRLEFARVGAARVEGRVVVGPGQAAWIVAPTPPAARVGPLVGVLLRVGP